MTALAHHSKSNDAPCAKPRGIGRQKEGPGGHTGPSWQSTYVALAEQHAPEQWSEPVKLSCLFMGESLSPPAVSNGEVATEFRAQILHLPNKVAGRVGNRTEQAAKSWKSDPPRAAPDSATLITAARRCEKVRGWLLWKVAGDWSRLLSPQVLTELQMLLVRTADGTGPDAKAARAILKEIHERGAVEP